MWTCITHAAEVTGWRPENEKVRVICGYSMSSKTAWTTSNPAGCKGGEWEGKKEEGKIGGGAEREGINKNPQSPNSTHPLIPCP